MVVRHVNIGDFWLGSHANTAWALLRSRPAVAEPRLDKSNSARIGRRCALVAGADSSIRQLLRTVLEIGDFEVAEVATHNEVLSTLTAADEMPQVILLDVLPPRFSGLQTLAYVRHDPRLANVPVIVLTSFAEPPEQARFQQHGATAVLTKPFSSQRLLDLVKQMATAS
jgi:CheY-like chemotaxis protein